MSNNITLHIVGVTKLANYGICTDIGSNNILIKVNTDKKISK